MEQGKYVVLDGMDGSGKGTQMALLRSVFSSSAVFTREPGGTPFAEEIRRVVRDNPLAEESTPLNNFLLFWAAREEVMHNLVMPALQSGKDVFSDRGDSSTFAFQIHGEENMDLLPLFSVLREAVFRARRQPDLYIIFDLPAGVARERVLRDSEREKNHFDLRDLWYYECVRQGFRNFANYAPVVLVDAEQSSEKIHHSVLEHLRHLWIR